MADARTDLFSIHDRVAIVTGASRGLGRAIAGGYLDAGARVVGASRTRWDLDDGDAALFVETDVARTEDLDALVQATLDRFGRIDILVNNAGMEIDAPAEETTLEVFDRTMSVNVRGAFHLCKRVGEGMLARGSGKIINVASVLGMEVFPGTLAYSASKAALIQMTKSLAVEWAPRGVHVNCILPGLFHTELVREILDDADQMAYARARNPCGWTADPREIVGTAIYLASEASNYVYGSILAVDGGELAGSGAAKAVEEGFIKGLRTNKQ